MKKIFLLVIASALSVSIHAQNLGIGATTPQYKLDVNGPVWLRHIDDDSTAGFWLEGTAGTNRSFWGILNNDKLGLWGSGGAGWGLTADLSSGRVGIGTINPAFKLDVNGRMRLKNTATNSAGFTIEGTDAAHRTFIGTMNDNHLGIFSQSGIGWFFSMNVNNGNTGIGLANPTAKLDVSNSMRLRSGSPKLGSVLISADANGNAEWQQPWGFDAMGSFPSANEVLINTWSKIRFGYLSVTLNEGNSYDLNNGWFTAPVNGIYDLHLHVTFNDDYGHDKTYIRIIQQRNGVNTELLRYDLNQVHLNSLDPNTNGLYKLVKYPNLNYTTGGIVLNAADKIWAEVYAADRIIYRPTGSSITETWLDANDCKMTGSLVVKL